MAAHSHAKCPKCGTVLEIPVQGNPEGKRIRCGSCRGVFVLRRRSADSGTSTDPSAGTSASPSTGPFASPAIPRATPVPVGGSHTAPTALGQETTAGLSSLSSPSVPASPAAPAWRFDRGDEVAGRYRVVRRIARGGMGEVYEAEDHELGGTVALKTIRPEMAREAWSAERFRREIQLARRVTHPNVCRIFDVSYHPATAPATAGEGGDLPGGERVVFLTMELLRGETLTERLVRDGPMSPAEALPIARQLAAALDAAHAAGVIHRDFKSNNVMLVPPEPGSDDSEEALAPRSRDLRAVITDFGLARGAGDAGLAATLALGESSLGTPDYLAPEQVEGDEITSRVDVYAFGLVLYETVTGRLPFSGDTVLSIAVKRVREDAPSPRTHVPDLDRRWERAILGCLEREPEDRLATAGEAVRILEAETPSAAAEGRATPEGPEISSPAASGEPRTGPPETPPAEVSRKTPRETSRKTSRRQVALLALLVLVAVAVGVYRYRGWKTDRTDLLRPAVAVLGLRNLSGDPQAGWLGTAIAEMLRTELRAAEDLRVVSGDDVARMEVELELEPTSTARSPEGSSESLARIRRASGADYVVAGSYTLLGEKPERQVRLDLRLQDALSDETLASVAETGTEGELFELVAHAGVTLRNRLGVERPEASPGLLERLRRAALPSNPEAARLYTEALEDIRRFEPTAAKDRLVRAAELEPEHPLIHSGLALAWSALGYEERSREEAKRALELAEGLPRAERSIIEARYFEATGEWEQAVNTWRSLLVLYPDSVEYGVRLASSQIQAGQPREALTTLGELRSLPPPAGEDVRLDLTEAAAAAALGDAARQRDAAGRAAAKGREQKSRLLVAQARLAECNALLRLSRPQEARTACEESHRIFEDRGDRTGQASALTVTANILYDQGDLAGARERLERSLEVYRGIGNRRAVATVLNNLAVVVRNQGDLETALGMYEEALEIFRQFGSLDGEATTLTNLAPLLVRRGELSEARARLEKALEIRREIGDRQGEASALDQLGAVLREQGQLTAGRQRHQEALRLSREIGSRRSEVISLGHLGEAALDEGDLEGAQRRFGEALSLSQEIGYRSPEASARFGLAEVAFERNDLLAARQGHRRALELREELGERGAAAESRLALARVLLEAGGTEEAEELAHTAAEAFAIQGAVDRQAWALALRSAALQSLGRADEAGEAIRRALELGRTSENLPARNVVLLYAARLQALDGDLEGALSRLDTAAAAAREAGLLGLELEARLTRLELLAPQGEPLETAFDAELLAADARARGHERLARAAESLTGTPAETPSTAAAGAS